MQPEHSIGSSSSDAANFPILLIEGVSLCKQAYGYLADPQNILHKQPDQQQKNCCTSQSAYNEMKRFSMGKIAFFVFAGLDTDHGRKHALHHG